MSDLARLQRASRVFFAWLLIVYGAAAPDMLRQMADELEALAGEIALDEADESGEEH